MIPLTCTTAPSNPAVELRWNIGGKDVANPTSRTVVSSDNGWITYSNISLTVEPNTESVVVICSAISTLGDSKLATHTITVLSEYTIMCEFSWNLWHGLVGADFRLFSTD